jgi:ankyrin repeat protein
MLAAFDGHLETVRVLLDRAANPDLVDANGRSVLMFAASGPNHATVKLLLEHGADITLRDNEEGFTALMFAAAEGHADNVRELLAHKADPAETDIDGDAAIDFARRNGHRDVVDILSAYERRPRDE